MSKCTFFPSGVASVLNVTLENAAGTSMATCIFMSHERGVVVGIAAVPLDKTDWPEEVKAEVRRHFKTVFDLEHEMWKGPGPSPRAAYCDEAKKGSWSIEATSCSSGASVSQH